MYRAGKNLSIVLGQQVSQQADSISDSPAVYNNVYSLTWCYNGV